MNEREKKAVSNNAVFKKPDLILYLLVVIIVAVCFLIPIFTHGQNKNSFSVYKGEELVLTFDFESGDCKIENQFTELVIKSPTVDNSVSITIFTNLEKTEYNELLVDLENYSVKVVKSNCSLRKDCVHTPALEKGEGVIICLPHDLKIVPTGSNYIPVVSG